MRVAIAAAVFALAVASAGHAEVAALWTLEGLDSPESVALSGDCRFLYVANVGGEGDARDGDGYISRVSLDGRMIERRWATGMDAPKGAALKGSRLFVSDIDRLVEIDAASGAVLARYPAPGARFLNDVAVTADGRVLVSDSGTARIYVLGPKGMEVWLEDPRLKAINGILAEPDRLVVTTMAGKLLAIGLPGRTITEIASGIGDGDGLAALDDGGWLVSEWPGRLFHVAADGTLRTLIDGRAGETYVNDFIRVGDILYAPHWRPGSLTAHRVGSLLQLR